MNNYFKNIKFYFILLNVLFFLIGLINYSGNKFYFFIFAISINFFVIYSFREKSLFFEKILSLFIWLGFWFKLIYTISITGAFRHPVGNFDYSPYSFDLGLFGSV